MASAQAEADLPPEVTIPEELAEWLSFDAETGLLSGTPPADFIEKVTLTFLALESDGNLFEAESTLSVADGAQQDTVWFTYDDANRVTVDGGSLRESVYDSHTRMSIGRAIGIRGYEDEAGDYIQGQGQAIQYDAAGRLRCVSCLGIGVSTCLWC